MTTFEEHVARRDAERAARKRVTWRRVSDDTGGGHSGYGSGGRLVYVKARGEGSARRFDYGTVSGKERIRRGSAITFAGAKAAAEALLAAEPVAKLSPAQERGLRKLADYEAQRPATSTGWHGSWIVGSVTTATVLERLGYLETRTRNGRWGDRDVRITDAGVVRSREIF